MGIHLSGIVAAISTLPAALTVLLRHKLPLPLTLALAHVSLVGFAVALATTDYFAAHSTQLLGKTEAGQIPYWNLLLLWPYHTGLRTKLWVQRRTSTEPHWTLITDGWYIGGWPSSSKWMPPGNPSIVDCTCELPRRHSNTYLCLPTWDTHAPDVQLVEDGVKWLLQQRQHGRPVYVHCAHGHGRSTVVLCAALVASGYANSFEEAFQQVRAQRPRVKLNYRQRRTLIECAERRSKLS
ncbi:hypothetical protein ABBQ32_013494 [Trebouxia sp. C0010 RCD-2024]